MIKTEKMEKLPEGWKRVRLGEVCEKIFSGATPLRSDAAFWEHGEIPWLTNEEVQDGKINYIYGTREKVSKMALEKTNVNLIPSNALILSLTASVGKVAINMIPLTTNQQFNSFVLDNKRTISQFLAFYLLFVKNKIVSLGGSTTFDFISKSKITDFEIFLPPLPEQQKIAEILETVDNAIEKTDAIIQKYKRIKQGLMQDLLTRGVVENYELGIMNYGSEFRKRESGIMNDELGVVNHESEIGNWELRDEKKHKFKDSPLGRIPEEWEVVRLGDAAEILDNSRIPLDSEYRATIKGDFPYCGATGIIDYINDYIFDGEYLLIAEDGGNFDRFEETAYIMRGKFWVNNHVHILKGKNGILDNSFLMYFVNFQDVSRYISGSTREKLNQRLLKSVVIPLPPLSEQRHIASILSQVDEVIEKEQKYKEKLERIKQGLMEDLLTGRIMVNDLIEHSYIEN
jgi:type I restriction enzyme S subunit